ncbi:MAG: hypothetical protein DRJ03_27055 [Chloroflexi bacterium]|nr:MAG: hypothetical protein DRJ03_27055 [Chloroflexota bacterium]
MSRRLDSKENQQELIRRRAQNLLIIEKLAAKLLEEARDNTPTIKEGLHWGHIGDLEYIASKLAELSVRG